MDQQPLPAAPLLLDPNLRHRSRSSSPFRPVAPKLVRSSTRRRPRFAFLLAVLALSSIYFLYSSVLPPTVDLVTLLHYKLLDRAYDERWGWPLAPPCSLRKKPLVFVRGGGTAAVVWEANACGNGHGEWGLRWRRAEKTKQRVDRGKWEEAPVERTVLIEETDEQGARIVYSAALSGIQSGQAYEYEVLRRLSRTAVPVFAVKQTFPWLGVSSTSSSSSPTTLNIACVADNQYNLRVFSRILQRLSSFSRSLPSSFFSSPPVRLPSASKWSPHLLLHAGDVTQNPHNLAQWQTDLWDPLTRSSSSLPPPILLARGNHDWDKSGANEYTGGLSFSAALRQDYAARLASLSGSSGGGINPLYTRRGTYFSFSPHERFRILVLDSNLVTEAEQKEQERWVEWEVGRKEWRKASIRAVVVHTAPWIEWWDREAWTKGRESEWSSYVRTSLMPLLAQHGCSLVLSGHSHAYTRGFLPYSLVPSFSSATNSSSVSPLASAAAHSRAWERSSSVRETGMVDEPGMLLITFGGAGGSLDEDRVEEWGIMSRSISGKYHAGWLAASFVGLVGGREGKVGEAAAVKELERELDRAKGRRKEAPRMYRSEKLERCGVGEEEARDVVDWRAVGVNGREIDRVWLVGGGCV
ncbi:hypothetical protein JCM8547_007225 [Rhodosporidiobolus lusitaniae]